MRLVSRYCFLFPFAGLLSVVVAVACEVVAVLVADSELEAVEAEALLLLHVFTQVFAQDFLAVVLEDVWAETLKERATATIVMAESLRMLFILLRLFTANSI
ncbi:MAG: hypothetical protein ACFB10_24610 [Salibacteraceae bacterium]